MRGKSMEEVADLILNSTNLHGLQVLSSAWNFSLVYKANLFSNHVHIKRSSSCRQEIVNRYEGIQNFIY